MLSELTRRQFDAALSAAQAMVSADEPRWALELARHNLHLRRLDLPKLHWTSLRQLVVQVVMHAEMMKLRTVK